MKIKAFSVKSLTFRLTLALFCCILPLVSVALYNNTRSYQLVLQQVQDSRTYAISSNMKQLDQELYSASQYMNSLVFFNSDSTYLKRERVSPDYYYATRRLQLDLTDHAVLYRFVNGFFLYSPTSETFLQQISSDISIGQSDLALLRSALTDAMEAAPVGSTWETIDLNGTTWLFRILNQKPLYTAYCINIPFLEQQFSSENERILHASLTEDALLSVQNPDLLPIFTYSDNSPVIFEEILSKKEVVSGLPLMQRYYILILFTILLLIPILYLIIYQLVYRPLRYIRDSIQRIQNGELDYRMDNPGASAEFLQIHGSFNAMMDEIQSLKIGIYEEQLKTQQAEMDNIQFQLRPHFMINILNMVYNNILTGHDPEAQKIIRFSTRYLRYMVNTAVDFVPLSEELKHIENYMSLQQERYRDRFQFFLHTDPSVQDTRIPPFLLQNFLENSIKYGQQPSDVTAIQLDISYAERDFVPFTHIVIRDNGNGYPDDFLEKVKDPAYPEQKGEHIGIRNSLRRLGFLYHGNAVIVFRNENGAVSEFWLPLGE